MENVCACILAAGDGKRMKSAHPKVTCEVLFKPMIRWVTDACAGAGIRSGCAVLGAGAQEVAALLPQEYEYVLQDKRLGTGHAASMAREFLREGGFAHAAVLCGDAPLLCAGDLREALRQHVAQGAGVTLISARAENPAGYGRIIRDGERVAAIVEEKDADDAQRAVDEINSGAYWFETAFLLEFFDQMKNDNAQGEYYLTDAVAYAVRTGRRASAYTAPAQSALGANSRADLARLNQIAREEILRRHLENGVNIPFSDGVIIGPDCEIAPDATILPGTILRGKTKIGPDCEIGPNSYLIDAEIGELSKIVSSQITGSKVEDRVRIGPMSHIRPDCHIHSGVKIGDFVEVKNSALGEKTSVSHLTYVGDSDVGARCNLGCGVVTVNYDGSAKYRTIIGDDAFIGCNTNLVAPVSVGARVYAAAGTTITENVPAGSLVIGRSRQTVKENWEKTHGKGEK